MKKIKHLIKLRSELEDMAIALDEAVLNFTFQTPDGGVVVMPIPEGYLEDSNRLAENIRTHIEVSLINTVTKIEAIESLI